uniref:Hydroxypyruvate isomerase isoform X4 n=1 Tax=Castor canadensis TaxID=51338 RepID=A0A8B7VLB3_CASCN|nr:putative hydroxypyruvate isomerase isoform X4 [Castor canadensis]
MVVPGAPQPSRAAAGRGPLGLRSRRGGLAIRRAARGAGARGAGRGAAAGADQHAPWCVAGPGPRLSRARCSGRGVPEPALTPVHSAGDQEKGEMGLAAVPGRQAAFREGLEQAVLYAKALGCPRIHLMAGRVPQGADRAAVRGEMETVFLENLKYAAGVLAQDIFHWQIMDGNLTGNIREFLPIVGHVQVAQVPGRGEPGSSGELDFSYLFQLLEDEGYEGFVGCEYKPQGDTIAGLSWLRSYWDRRGHPQDGR